MLSSNDHPRWRAKLYNIRLLKHKYDSASTKLDRINSRLKNGELIDLIKLKE